MADEERLHFDVSMHTRGQNGTYDLRLVTKRSGWLQCLLF
jgi:hypothetical protein